MIVGNSSESAVIAFDRRKRGENKYSKKEVNLKRSRSKRTSIKIPTLEARYTRQGGIKGYYDGSHINEMDVSRTGWHLLHGVFQSATAFRL